MTFNIFQLIVIQLFLPAAFIISLWKESFHSKIEWMVQCIFTVLYTSWLLFSSPWDWFSYYWRFIWLILLLLAVYISWEKVRPLPLLLIFGAYNVLIFSGYSTQNQEIELDFPLKNGTYYLIQ